MTPDDDALRARLAAPLARLAARRRDAEGLAEAIDDAAQVLRLLGARAPRARDLARAVNTGADAAGALFGPSSSAHLVATPERWLTGHALACVARRTEAIGRLAAGGGPTGEGPRDALARALARWWRQDPAWSGGLELAVADAGVSAQARLLRAIAARDLDAVDLALAAGLLAANPDEVPVELLGLACLAEGVGLVPRVESPRLPTYLVRGPARVRPGVVKEPLFVLGEPDGRTPLARAAELGVQAVPALRALAAGADLRPRPGDWARVFRHGGEEARAAYERGPAPRLVVAAGQTTLDVLALPAWTFGAHPAARDLPGGYARIRERLDPDRVWVSARFHRPDEALGVRVDGLVWLDDRWVWVPKPWRLVGGG